MNSNVDNLLVSRKDKKESMVFLILLAMIWDGDYVHAMAVVVKKIFPFINKAHLYTTKQWPSGYRDQ
jgi:hypothetical protein